MLKRIPRDLGEGGGAFILPLSLELRATLRARGKREALTLLPSLGTCFFFLGTKPKSSLFFFTHCGTHLVSSATVLEQSTGTSRRLEDTGSLPMSTRSRILFAEDGGEGDVDISWERVSEPTM